MMSRSSWTTGLSLGDKGNRCTGVCIAMELVKGNITSEGQLRIVADLVDECDVNEKIFQIMYS
jgi:hypothetical protein